MKDTHDNGREEQWRWRIDHCEEDDLGPESWLVFLGTQDNYAVEMRNQDAYVADDGKKRVLAFPAYGPDDATQLRDYLNELETARAQAGLAQRLVACAHKVKPEYSVEEAHCEHCGVVLTLDWTPYEALRDALTAGPTAKESAEPIELGWASLGTSDEEDKRIRQFMEEGESGPTAAAE